MVIVLDTTTLTLFLRPTVTPPNDPATGKPLTYAAERIEHAIEQLSKAQGRVLIPATAWAEFLVCADKSAQEYIEKISDKATFEVVAFDAIAAIEAAIDQRNALLQGSHKADLSGSRQCIKADRQIVAVAKTRRADAVYATDSDIAKICESMKVAFVGVWELPVPPSPTPLLDAADVAEASADSVSTSSEPPPQPVQSASDAPPTDSQSGPFLPASPLAGPEQPQPDSSPDAQPPPQSEK